MAYPVEVTLQTGNKVSLNYQSQSVGVSITYRLERGDTEVLAVVAEKAEELLSAHSLAWKQVQGEIQPFSIPKPNPETSGDKSGQEERHRQEQDIGQECESTETQIRLVVALGQQGGLTKEELEKRIQATYQKERLEELNHNQAAALITDLGREGRQRFERERT